LLVSFSEHDEEMVGKRKQDSLVFWVREGGRMRRLAEPALLSHSEVLILYVEDMHKTLLDSAAIPQPMPNFASQRAWTPTQDGLLGLPDEILDIIVKSLSVSDVENMSVVCGR